MEGTERLRVLLLAQPEGTRSGSGAWNWRVALAKEQIRQSSRRASGPKGCLVDLRTLYRISALGDTAEHHNSSKYKAGTIMHYGFCFFGCTFAIFKGKFSCLR